MVRERWSKEFDKCVLCGKTDYAHKAKGVCKKCYQRNKQSTKGVCPQCGQVKALKHMNSNKQRICSKCYPKPMRLCAECNKYGAAGKRDSNGNYICISCYRKNHIPKRMCSNCGKLKITKKFVGEKPICQNCYNKHYRPKMACSSCGKEEHIHLKTEDKCICKKCYNKKFRPKRVCSICNEVNVIEKSTDGIDICVNCYRTGFSPIKTCAICGLEKAVHKIDGDKNICRSCYDKSYRPMRVCSNCGKLDIVEKIVDGKDICPLCYTRYYYEKIVCSICGIPGRTAKIENGNNICITCYNKGFRPKSVCMICKDIKSSHKIINGNSICNKCYQRDYQPIKKCSICGLDRKLAVNEESNRICVYCYAKIEGKCLECGNVTKNYYKSLKLCNNCRYTKKISELLSEKKQHFKNPSIYNLLCKYIKLLTEHRVSITVFFVFIEHLEFFEFLDSADIQLNTAVIEFFSTNKDFLYNNTYIQLRNFLIKENLLELKAEENIFLDTVNVYKENLPVKFQAIFMDYSRKLLETRNKFQNKGWDNRFSFKTCNNYAYIAFYFLNYISKEIKSINELTNECIDNFCNNNADYFSSGIRQFIKWVNINIKLFKRIKLPKYVEAFNGGTPYSEEELMQIVESLSLPSVSYKEKVLGFLLIFYAIRPFELSEIKLSDYRKDGNDGFLKVRNVEIKLHTFVSSLLNKYICDERSSKLSLGSEVEWLFYGINYNKPLSVARICELLKKHGINSIRTFSSSVTNALFTEVTHPSIIIKGLGLSISTVIGYYKAMNSDNLFEINTNEDFNMSNKNYTSDITYYTYILKCADGSYYTGYTSDLNERYSQHQKGSGSAYTKTRRPVDLVYTESYPSKVYALKREKQIKKMTIYEKEQLIEKGRMN